MLKANIPVVTECRKTWINLMVDIVEIIPYIGKAVGGIGEVLTASDSISVYLNYSTELFKSHMKLIGRH